MSWVSQTSSSHKVHLGVTAVVSGIFAACAVIGYQKVRRKERIQHIKEEIPDVSPDHAAARVRPAVSVASEFED
jgi:hypothetical protein